MVPIVRRLADDFDGRALVGTVDAAAQGGLADSWRISLVPTFVFFKDGREVSRQTGTTSYEDLAGKLQALVNAP
jgi:thioredoxin 1